MAEKKTPPPIDRPLSKAYLREFSGWSTAYPPGLSEPTSLRLMENVLINRDGAAQVRPGLRAVLRDPLVGVDIVGGFEAFFTVNSDKALLFAVREAGGEVGFRVAVDTGNDYVVTDLDDASLGFDIPDPAALPFTSSTTYVRYVQIDNKILALSNAGESMRMFYVGSSPSARKLKAITVPAWDVGSTVTIRHPDAAWINNVPAQTNPPTAETPSAETLISSDGTKNTYSYGYFYTFENEVGESAPSQTRVIKASRGWSQWRFLKPATDGSETTDGVTDPKAAMDQLVAVMPQGSYDTAVSQGALRWNLYMFTWSDQDSVPSEGVLVASRDLTEPGATYGTHGWAQHTAAIDISSTSAILPSENNLINYSDPSNASQGLVAGDRVVLVRDNGSRILWSSSQIGEYTNFSPTKGGGAKTLTAGNMQIPVAVKLWQNPQSVDTITILCSGVDGYSTSYYMAPSVVSGQSQSTAIMGFEETTATQGTVSPYGVEVLNNALYHPLDTELVKSTASNYNISHTTMTLDVANVWQELENKSNIVSSQLDNRLYYIVHNPDGEPLQDGCMGNEVWVYDAAKDTGRWNRWLVQGIALRKLQLGDKLYMAIAQPQGLFVFDDLTHLDQYVTGSSYAQRPIPWQLKTNTLGANRAHDAWARLQQMELTLGNWRGSMRYGLQGWDVNGKPVEFSKVYHGESNYDMDDSPRPRPFDVQDYLQIRKEMKEWFFFAESIPDEPSYGQVNYVQFRFTPVSVNVGYEYGSVETFEYSRTSAGAPSYTDNGTPLPYIDTRRP